MKYGNNSGVTTLPTGPGQLFIDRGYTGHEHLLGVGLINMNARLYDPILHRFLAPDNFIQDPFNSQSFNRYGYAVNNPLKYTDPSGEFLPLIVIAIGAAIGAAAYIGTALRTGDWNWGHLGLAVLGGAIVGALTAGQLPASIGMGYVYSSMAAAFVGGLLPSLDFSVGDWNFSISAAMAFGNGVGVGANFSVGYNDGNFSVSGGIGTSYYGKAYGTNKSNWEFRTSGGANWDDGKNGFGLYTTDFSSGETSQRVGGLSARSGDFGLRFENDFMSKLTPVLADGGDRFRSAALSLSYKNYEVGFKLYTGDPALDKGDSRKFSGATKGDGLGLDGSYLGPNANKYRLGAAYAGYKGYKAGWSGESVRGFIQNNFHNLIGSPRFPELATVPEQPYFQYQSYNPYTLW